jgi:hypothetical protein
LNKKIEKSLRFAYNFQTAAPRRAVPQLWSHRAPLVAAAVAVAAAAVGSIETKTDLLFLFFFVLIEIYFLNA